MFVNAAPGSHAVPRWSAYTASKAALRELADSLREEEDRHGVRVTTIYPAGVGTELLRKVREQLGRPYDPATTVSPKTLASVVLSPALPLSTSSRSEEASMDLVNDLHHMAFLTADMDRLISFYERIFDARVTLDREEEGLRHAFIEIGPHTVLHPFEVQGVEVPSRQPIFRRGRLDHFALNAASEEAFREVRRRLIAEGANATEGGLVTDMGSMLSFSFHDPDDGWHEIMWVKPGPAEETLKGPRTGR
jgi:catechol 2,3-dioxygenase-like lactoylglutathione lyase family enzyme